MSSDRTTGTRKSIYDKAENLRFNRARWGDRQKWQELDQFGYRWGGGVHQTTGQIAKFADEFLRPFVPGYENAILEIAPGAGRFTAELVRYGSCIDLLDMNRACLDICYERFRYYPIEIGYYENDGESCDMLPDREYDIIASFDSMVHMHPDVIQTYVAQLAPKLAPGGILWIDHSGKGIKELGHRTDMTAEKIAAVGIAEGLAVLSQRFRNDHDCVSVFSQPKALSEASCA